MSATSETLSLGQLAYNLEGYFGEIQYFTPGNQLVDQNIPWVKIGVQAPAGTKVIINGEEIIIGRSGIYELDHDFIAITSVIVPVPEKYVLKLEATEQALAEGKAEMQTAKDAFNNASDIAAQKAALDDWNAAYLKYMSGVNGIYKAENDYSSLKNIIIDYAYYSQLSQETN